MGRGLSNCRPREGGDPYAVSKRGGADFEQSTSSGVWVPAFAGTTRSIQPNVSGCCESSSEPTLSSVRAGYCCACLTYSTVPAITVGQERNSRSGSHLTVLPSMSVAVMLYPSEPVG